MWSCDAHRFRFVGQTDDLPPVRPRPNGHRQPAQTPAPSDFEQLSTDAGTSPDGVTREGVYSHGGYPQLGNNQELRMSGYNMAAVVAGLPDQMVRR